MSGNYRVEKSSTGRAGCQATDCKKSGVKIDKGSLRLGTWVVIEDRGGWRWRHWGCVTGKVLENIRKGIEDPANPGQYRWDYLDGYEGEDKHGLEDSPELQEKVRRVITQGFIDAEDWRGDPEMNQLGQTGMHTKENAKKARDEQKASGLQEQLDDLKAQLEATAPGSPKIPHLENQIKDIEDKLDEVLHPTPKKKPSQKKRKAATDEDEDDEVEQAKPAPKKRATKSKKEADTDEEADSKPAPKKSRAKKVVKKEDDDKEHEEEEKKPAPPAKKQKGRMIKKEEDIEMDDEEDVKPAKKSRANKVAVKKEENDDDEKPAPKKRAAPRGKVAVKKELSDDADKAPAKPTSKKPGKTIKKKTVDASNPGMTDGSSLDDPENFPAEAADLQSDVVRPGDVAHGSEIADASSEPVVADNALLEVESPKAKPKKKGKTKAPVAKASKSNRASRSRTASGI